MKDKLYCKYLLPWEKYGYYMLRRRYYDPSGSNVGWYYIAKRNDYWEVYTGWEDSSLREFKTGKEAMTAMDKRLGDIGYVLLTEETMLLL
jgi:hypothetical protein